LRGKQDEVDEFLEDLRREKEEKRLKPVREDTE
jgi:hypothetical protein